MKKQRGYLLLIAAFLVVIGGFVVVTITDLVTNEASAASSDHDASQAFYVASAGLARAKLALTSTDFSERVACDDITGASDFTNVSVGDGQFTVTGVASTTTSASLEDSVTSTSTIIPVSSLTNYTEGGRVQIDGEAIDYTHTSTNPGDCSGEIACLLGVTRGVGDTIATTHSNGATVSQIRCHLTSTGYVPDATNPDAQRELTQDIFGIGNGNYGWIIGNTDGGETIYSLSGTTWVQHGPSSDIPNKTLYSIDMVNSTDAWIVGARSNNQPTLVHWDGSSLNYYSDSSLPNRDALGVSCVASDDCWAVGKRSTFIHWNGSTWSTGATDSSIPTKTVRGVYCVATDDCWAVGDREGGSAFIARWNGTTWSRYADPDTCGDDDDDSSGESCLDTNTNLNAITCTATDNCIAVGSLTTVLQWDGSSWTAGNMNSNVPSSGRILYGVSCAAEDSCWIVGNRYRNRGFLLYWDGTDWSYVRPDTSVTNNVLRGIDCPDSEECWAVGNNGEIIYWNGVDWEATVTTGQPSVNLRDIAIPTGASNLSTTNWSEQ